MYVGSGAEGEPRSLARGSSEQAQIIVIVGATASGKTELSLNLAEALGGASAVEIISADAFQLYRGMDIGTAKVKLSERRGIPHHQIDVLDISQAASVAAYQAAARADLERIVRRGKRALIVGGSGLYVSGLLDELNFPGHDDAVRAQLETQLTHEGIESLVSELQRLDPEEARQIDLANPRRVVRALEILRINGGKPQPHFPRHTDHYPAVVRIGLMWERAEELERIAARTNAIFDAGLVEETRDLLDRGLRESPTARRATGYKEAMAVLEGTMTQAQARDAVNVATRQLARKQRTWFRADPRIQWLRGSTDAQSLVQQVLCVLGAQQ
ncbi:MAG: tRNA (adenosine(37)-N6)-dimethylallyltransferase MiaA [Actinomycetaceae bacterium]|nr:tRNA (adenosine(37)-N6)-dimethylallyltransferase MiaA [Actinomycetaceae bacterium]MDY6083016.1 tRNA (adenosine(37)-N6)-dimethylallyltransferase MiaA [Actinomycetaceae bacterium]